MSRSAQSFPWFRLHDADWDAEEVATLNLTSQGFLLLLHRRMLKQMSPISMDVVRFLAKQHHMNSRTFEPMVETLVKRGLIFETDAGFWCDAAEREFINRGGVSKIISKRNRNVSRKRWEKDKQNQRYGMPEEELAKTGGAPSGRPLYSDDVSYKYSADAGCAPDAASDDASAHREYPFGDDGGDWVQEFDPDIDQAVGAGETHEAPSSAPLGADDPSNALGTDAAVRATYEGQSDPSTFLKSIEKTTVISFCSSKARTKLIEFMASSSERPGLAGTALNELFDRDELTKGAAIEALRTIWKEYGGENHVKEA